MLCKLIRLSQCWNSRLKLGYSVHRQWCKLYDADFVWEFQAKSTVYLVRMKFQFHTKKVSLDQWNILKAKKGSLFMLHKYAQVYKTCRLRWFFKQSKSKRNLYKSERWINKQHCICWLVVGQSSFSQEWTAMYAMYKFMICE